MGFPVSDYERSKAFYAASLAPLGYELVIEIPGEHTESRAPAVGFGRRGKPDFWIGGEGGPERSLHIAILAKNRASVDTFYAAAIRREERITAVPDCVPIIMPTITRRSRSIRMATTSKRSATRPNEAVPHAE